MKDASIVHGSGRDVKRQVTLGGALPPSRLRWDRPLDDSVESLGSERGVIAKVEVDVAFERAIRVERGPAATTHIVALVGALPRELNAGSAVTIRVAAVEFSRHHDEAKFAEAVVIELDEAGLEQIDGFLLPVAYLGDTSRPMMLVLSDIRRE